MKENSKHLTRSDELESFGLCDLCEMSKSDD